MRQSSNHFENVKIKFTCQEQWVEKTERVLVLAGLLFRSLRKSWTAYHILLCRKINTYLGHYLLEFCCLKLKVCLYVILSIPFARTTCVSPYHGIYTWRNHSVYHQIAKICFFQSQKLNSLYKQVSEHLVQVKRYELNSLSISSQLES